MNSNRKVSAMPKPDLQPLETFRTYEPAEMLERAKTFYDEIRRRRTVRDYVDTPIDREVIENCLLAAGTAPNGANQQPWHFAVVTDAEIKHRIRIEAEKEELEFYNGRAPQDWLDALSHLGTDEKKPFLEIAPYLIVIFAKPYDLAEDGSKIKNYYASESVGIATGMLITALHNAGIATLTHTPSPMKFLNEVLERPSNERPFLILVTGFPTADAKVPKITKKSLNEIASFH